MVHVTYRITLTEAPENSSELTDTANVTDISGNACAETISMIYNAGNLVTDSLQTDYGFTVFAEIAVAEAAAASVSATTLVAQGDAYALGINENSKAYFTVNGAPLFPMLLSLFPRRQMLPPSSASRRITVS